MKALDNYVIQREGRQEYSGDTKSTKIVLIGGAVTLQDTELHTDERGGFSGEVIRAVVGQPAGTNTTTRDKK